MIIDELELDDADDADYNYYSNVWHFVKTLTLSMSKSYILVLSLKLSMSVSISLKQLSFQSLSLSSFELLIPSHPKVFKNLKHSSV